MSKWGIAKRGILLYNLTCRLTMAEVVWFDLETR